MNKTRHNTLITLSIVILLTVLLSLLVLSSIATHKSAAVTQLSPTPFTVLVKDTPSASPAPTLDSDKS